MAIAFDNSGIYTSSGVNGTTAPVTLTIGTGTNRAIVVFIHTYINGEANPSCAYTGTYDSITRITADVNDVDVGDTYVFLILNPQSGSQTVTVTTDARDWRRMTVLSYSGVRQSATVDNSSNFNLAGTSANISQTLNPKNDASWLVMGAINGNGILCTAGASTTVRQWHATHGFGSGDSGGVNRPSAIAFTGTGTLTDWGGATIALAPAPIDFPNFKRAQNNLRPRPFGPGLAR